MDAVEFEAIIKDGVIEVPAEYRDRFREPVRVILLAPERSAVASKADELPRRSILEIEGVGKDIWQAIDVDAYLDEERAAWDG